MAFPQRIEMLKTIHVVKEDGKGKLLRKGKIYEGLGKIGAKLIGSGVAVKAPPLRRKKK